MKVVKTQVVFDVKFCVDESWDLTELLEVSRSIISDSRPQDYAFSGVDDFYCNSFSYEGIRSKEGIE